MKNKCPQCGIKPPAYGRREGLCRECIEENRVDEWKITLLQRQGHTHHCACTQVWSGEKCECQKKGVIPGRISRMIEAVRQFCSVKGR